MEVLNHNIVNTKNDDTIVPCGGGSSKVNLTGIVFLKLHLKARCKYMYFVMLLILVPSPDN